MIRIAARGRKAAELRLESRSFGQIPAIAGAFVLALAVTPVLAPQAAAQSNSGIYINNDVLNSLGPGPDAAPVTPLAPTAAPAQLSPYGQPSYQAPGTPPAGGSNGGLSFQPYGSGNFVVTRPGTLLFPPLQDPTSTLTPGFGGADNQAARARALDNAFAEGPEPQSQLLIPLQSPGESSDSVQVFMDNLPPADPDADRSSAPVLVLQSPPQPAPRKPEVPAQLLAEYQSQPLDAEGPAELAPEFRTPEPPVMADLPAELTFAERPTVAEVPADAEATAPEMPIEEMPAEESLAETPAVDETPLPTPAEAPVGTAPAGSAEVAAPVAMAEAPAESAPAAAQTAPAGDGPVSLLPSPATGASAADSSAESPTPDAPASLQTASLTVGGGVEDMTFLFDVDSAELSSETQFELRSLAHAMLSNEDWIQVLGFASAEDSSGDQARKLALSRALKVRSFLIDAGIPSTRIQVRSLGDRAEGGPANRVDIKPIGS